MTTLTELKTLINTKLAEKDAKIADLTAKLAAAPSQAELDALAAEIDPTGGNPGSEEPPKP